ncbi:hypothetical protein V8E52_005720 [Russula decolorans]
MFDVAETLDPLPDVRTRHLTFFDGEEAFIAWTATDSIYRAWSVSPPPPLSLLRSYVSPPFLLPHADASPKYGGRRTCPHIQSAASPPPQHPQLLVLFDILGAPHPKTRLRDAGIIDAAAFGGSFSTCAAGDISLAYIGDDHLPFLHRGDDATALDPTLHVRNVILRVFFAEYLGLHPKPSSKHEEPSSPTHLSAPVRKSESEL